MQRGALSDWELRYARAKLELKERHYKEFAECLNELSPDQAAEHQRAIEQANEKARQLAEIKNNLEDQRKENEDKMQRELEGDYHFTDILKSIIFHLRLDMVSLH